MKIPAVFATMLALGIGLTTPGVAHEDAVLKSPQTSVAAGGVVSLQGTEFEAGGRYTLKLTGALREYSLGAVVADTAGEFSIELLIAATAVPGSYSIEAVASDGDVVARLDMIVLPASPGASAEQVQKGAMDEMQHGTGGMAPMARSDDIQIDRDRSAIEWGLIGLLIGAAAGLGSRLILTGRSR